MLAARTWVMLSTISVAGAIGVGIGCSESVEPVADKTGSTETALSIVDPPFCECGNGRCQKARCGETRDNCEVDCGCGNGRCDPGDLVKCPAECPGKGNGVCDPGENACNTPEDCKPPAVPPCCGNGMCEEGEIEGQQYSCPVDCGSCGDGTCSGDKGENCNSCPADCDSESCGTCFPSLRKCLEACPGVCERRILCGGASAHKCF